MTNDNDRAILRTLLASSSYVSGEFLGNELNLTRTAVWKRINKLRKLGFRIDSSRNRGYRLVSVPDRLYPSLVASRLSTELIGRTIIYMPRIDSTNHQAKKYASNGAEEGTVVVCEHQSAGHGRLRRAWISPFAKNLLFSIIFYPSVPPTSIFYLTMFSSLAVCAALKNHCGLDAGIKWPNDIFVNNKKICGVLTEFSAHHDRVSWAIVGIGLNVNSDPSADEFIRDSATSIFRETGKPCRRVPLLQTILTRIDRLYGMFRAGQLEQLRREWLERSVVIGKPVRIMADEQREIGIAESIDEQGALLLRTENGALKRIVYGDLSLRLLP